MWAVRPAACRLDRCTRFPHVFQGTSHSRAHTEPVPPTRALSTAPHTVPRPARPPPPHPPSLDPHPPGSRVGSGRELGAPLLSRCCSPRHGCSPSRSPMSPPVCPYPAWPRLGDSAQRWARRGQPDPTVPNGWAAPSLGPSDLTGRMTWTCQGPTQGAGRAPGFHGSVHRRPRPLACWAQSLKTDARPAGGAQSPCQLQTQRGHRAGPGQVRQRDPGRHLGQRETTFPSSPFRMDCGSLPQPPPFPQRRSPPSRSRPRILSHC